MFNLPAVLQVPPAYSDMYMDKQFVVGVDVGGQTSKIGVVDARGVVLTQSVIRTDSDKDPQIFIDSLATAIK